MSALQALRRSIEALPGFDPAVDDPETILAGLEPEALAKVYAQVAAEEEHAKFSKFDTMFPDDGPFRRELYPKHMEFFSAGKTHRERLFMAGNRVGKTLAGSMELAQHLTGRYKPWWPGRKFRRPNRWWVAGETNTTTREVLQVSLLGEITYSGNRKTVDGSGIIPRDCIGNVTWKQGVPDAVDTAEISYRTGGWSLLGFKSYDQGRRVFQGTAKEGIWLDEEPPADVYGECLMRTATTRGLIMVTFTPLLGMSEVVRSFLPRVDGV